VNSTIECTGTPTFTAPTATDACSSVTVNLLSDVTATGTCGYSETRTWNAVDGCGNTSNTVSQTITITDTTPPVIGGQGANSTIECTGTPSFTAPTASDACSSVTVNLLSDVTATGTCGYSETRTWNAVDGCGNTSNTLSQTITIADTTPPTIGGQGANSTIECTGTPSFTAPTATDACSGVTVNLLSDVTVSGTCGYSETRTWNAVDGCGNTSNTVSQTITIADTTPPTIGGQGANSTIECTGTPSFTAPTAADACSSVTINLLSDVTTTGTCGYSETRTWNAVDGCGNTSSTVSQTITVTDTTPPVIGAAGVNATIECTGTPSFTAPTATDACSSVTVNLLSDVTVSGT